MGPTWRQHGAKMGHHVAKIGQHGAKMVQHGAKMSQHGSNMGQHGFRFGSLGAQMGQLGAQMGQLGAKKAKYPIQKRCEDQFGTSFGQMLIHPSTNFGVRRVLLSSCPVFLVPRFRRVPDLMLLALSHKYPNNNTHTTDN